MIIEEVLLLGVKVSLVVVVLLLVFHLLVDLLVVV